MFKKIKKTLMLDGKNWLKIFTQLIILKISKESEMLMTYNNAISTTLNLYLDMMNKVNIGKINQILQNQWLTMKSFT